MDRSESGPRYCGIAAITRDFGLEFTRKLGALQIESEEKRVNVLILQFFRRGMKPFLRILACLNEIVQRGTNVVHVGCHYGVSPLFKGNSCTDVDFITVR